MPRLAAVLTIAALAAIPIALHAQGAQPLRVIRVAPAGEANPMAQITVTFSKPITGSLDRVINPKTILKVEPPVVGRIEWRDPVTIRLVPSTPLKAGTRYTVTVANNFKAMDGSALMEPYTFAFRAQGPTIMEGFPVGPPATSTPFSHATPNQQFQLAFTNSVNLDLLSSAAYIEFSAVCTSQRIVRVRATSQRAIKAEDHWRLREAGGYGRDRSLDSLRRAVVLTPQTALPRDCSGDLVLPVEVEREFVSNKTRWHFSTYGDLHVTRFFCDNRKYCPAGPLRLEFTNPVRGAEVLRNVRLAPAAQIVIRDTISESTTWMIESTFTPRTKYTLSVNSALRDVFAQQIRTTGPLQFTTTGYAPAINHPFGSLLVERVGFGTLSVGHINVDTLIATIAAVPDSLEPQLLSRFGWGYDSAWLKLAPRATTRRIPQQSTPDKSIRTSIPIPGPTAAGQAASATLLQPALFAVRIWSNSTGGSPIFGAPLALIQVTDLAVHARVGVTEGAVWVTGVNDGLPKEGATVVLHDIQGRALATARSDARGIAQFSNWSERPASSSDDPELGYRGFEGYVKVSLGTDRAITTIRSWDPDLSPWRFGVYSAWEGDRRPLAGALFTERGIYRPGERVHAKAIIRDGSLGSLRPPAARDSVKWLFLDRDGGVLREVTQLLSSYGTASDSVLVPSGAAIGHYSIEIRSMRQGSWHSVASTSYRVAEYRPPEFLVDVTPPTELLWPGDRFTAEVAARYLFGAPMGRAALTWVARQSSLPSYALQVPGVEGWYIGATDAWWQEEREGTRILASGMDTLDVRGETSVSIKLPLSDNGRASRVTIETSVTDVNRQAVGASASTLVHPADFYIAAKAVGKNYFWQAGEAQTIQLLAVRPNGDRWSGARISGTIIRREWHRVRRERNGITEMIGEWVSDTVARCAVVSSESEQSCKFTPSEGGTYIIGFESSDSKGRKATTRFQRWTAGKDWVPWNDESQFRMDIIPDRARYSVGDTATVLFASPFTDAEAWITVEREGIIEQRRMRFTSGSTTLKFPITENFAPNAFISVVVARGRSAPPGPLDDPGRPTIRVGYAQIRVTPEIKRLNVTLTPERKEYLPADSVRVRIAVKDIQGTGRQSEVTLWAVDEGVLALTGYVTPDPLDLVYRERGLGMRLASNLTSVAPQVPEGEKGSRAPGGGGGADAADVLRSRFQTTAFFLGSVITNGAGEAVAAAKLPDNLTTFRVMAVAVTAGDRYGKGEATILVTRPLLARPSLPRFVRPGDRFDAGAVINRRDGSPAKVSVIATVSGVSSSGSLQKDVTLAQSRGTEVRFPFTALRGDSATFRFDVSGGADKDAVQIKIPLRPDHYPRAHVVAGALRGRDSVTITLPVGIDAQRSRLSVNVGSSPLAMIRGMAGQLHIYPYYCSEQITSMAMPTIALYRAQRQTGTTLIAGNPALEIARAVELLARRQTAEGAIGYWSSDSWSSPWLSAYAGLLLIEAREVGVAVDSTMLDRLAAYIASDLRGAGRMPTPLRDWYQRRELELRDRVASVDFLSRYGRPDVPAENELLRSAALLTTEDRARLAEVLARRGQTAAARQLIAPVWATVRVEGRTATIPDTARTFFYFDSNIRPLARLLTATLAVEPQHALVGPMVEALAQRGRAGQMSYMWNTQDYASAVLALAAFDRLVAQQGTRSVFVRSGNRVLLEGATGSTRAGRDSSVALAGLLTTTASASILKVVLEPNAGAAPLYYFLTVTEVPSAPPVTPEDLGIKVERWYETYPGGKPTTTVIEGDLVRVRIRVTVPTSRNFVVIDDPLPAGLEVVDMSLRTASALPGPGQKIATSEERIDESGRATQTDAPWRFGRWDSGWWSAFDHRELRDDRVVYSATVLWPGSYTATYVARATTPGTFLRPPVHAEEMYNPGVNGRSDGGTFVVRMRPTRGQEQ